MSDKPRLFAGALRLAGAVEVLASFAMVMPFTWIDLSAGMPWWWIASEGGSVLCLGFVLSWLLRDTA